MLLHQGQTPHWQILEEGLAGVGWDSHCQPFLNPEKVLEAKCTRGNSTKLSTSQLLNFITIPLSRFQPIRENVTAVGDPSFS